MENPGRNRSAAQERRTCFGAGAIPASANAGRYADRPNGGAQAGPDGAGTPGRAAARGIHPHVALGAATAGSVANPCTRRIGAGRVHAYVPDGADTGFHCDARTRRAGAWGVHAHLALSGGRAAIGTACRDNGHAASASAGHTRARGVHAHIARRCDTGCTASASTALAGAWGVYAHLALSGGRAATGTACRDNGCAASASAGRPRARGVHAHIARRCDTGCTASASTGRAGAWGIHAYVARRGASATGTVRCLARRNTTCTANTPTGPAGARRIHAYVSDSNPSRTERVRRGPIRHPVPAASTSATTAVPRSRRVYPDDAIAAGSRATARPTGSRTPAQCQRVRPHDAGWSVRRGAASRSAAARPGGAPASASPADAGPRRIHPHVRHGTRAIGKPRGPRTAPSTFAARRRCDGGVLQALRIRAAPGAIRAQRIHSDVRSRATRGPCKNTRPGARASTAGPQSGQVVFAADPHPRWILPPGGHRHRGFRADALIAR